MSKGLEALNRIVSESWVENEEIDLEEDIKLVETELKRLEEYDKHLKGDLLGCVVYKQGEILRIIKEKKVNCLEISTCADYKTYMVFFDKWNWYGEYDEFILTEQEFDLLKEWLK